MNAIATRWQETDFALMNAAQLDQAHQDLASAWCHHVSGSGKAGDATANALQMQMRFVGFLINPATEPGLKRLSASETRIGISIAPAEEYLPDVRTSKHRKPPTASAPIDAADAAVKAARRGGQQYSKKTREIIRLHLQGMSNPEIRKVIGCDKSRVWQVVDRYKETGRGLGVEA